MAEIVVFVSLQAAEGRGDEIAKAFAEAIPPTHAEEGCLVYALHRDNADPDHFVHVERWRSQEDLDAHGKTPHLRQVFTALGAPGLLAGAPSMWLCSAELYGDAAKGAI
jgi:quinol monooxygenase YgiN